MGEIRDIVKGLDASSNVYNEQKELIETLALLANTKADAFALEIEKYIAEANSEFNKSLPVESWLETRKETHAIYTDSTEDLIKKVSDGIKQFINTDDTTSSGKSNNIVDGVGTLLGTAVKAFLGSGSSSDDKLERMVVYLSGFGVERLDFKVWKREIEGSGLSTKVSKVTCFVAVRSSVDMANVKLNTFVILYSKQLKAMGYGQDKLEEAIDAAKRILSKFQLADASMPSLIHLPTAEKLMLG